MAERMGREPGDARDILSAQEKPLVRAAADLARAVAGLEPDPEYAPEPPQALLVGGFVRDALLGLHPKDADIEVRGVSPDRLKDLLTRLYGKVELVGEQFAVLKVALGNGLDLDVSIPRTESKQGSGHRGFAITGDPSLSVKEAARRRDFTVNAMSMDPVTGVIFDPFGGGEDLASRTLRVVDAVKFGEDPLRVLRAAQFVARFEFAVDPESERVMRAMAAEPEFAELPRERVTEEIEKLLLKGVRPSLGVTFLRRIGALEASFPGARVDDPDAWGRLLDRSVAHRAEPHASLAAFLSGFSADTRAAAAASLAVPKRDLARVDALLAAAAYQDPAPTNPANDARRTLKRVLPAAPAAYAAWLHILERGEEADRFVALVRDRALDAKPLLQGRDLLSEFSLRPGPKFQEILDAVEAARDRADIETREQALALAKTLL